MTQTAAAPYICCALPALEKSKLPAPSANVFTMEDHLWPTTTTSISWLAKEKQCFQYIFKTLPSWQWPQLYDLCHTFLHVLFSHCSRFFYLCNMQKHETKSDTWGHCLLPSAQLTHNPHHQLLLCISFIITFMMVTGCRRKIMHFITSICIFLDYSKGLKCD